MLLWKWSPRLASIFVLVSLAVTAFWHLPFFLTNQPYDPFHLWDRARGGMGAPLMLAGAVATAVAGAFAFLRSAPTRSSLHGGFVLCFLVPLVFLSGGELIAVGGDLARWEGANYLLPVLGAALAWLCTEWQPISLGPPVRA